MKKESKIVKPNIKTHIKSFIINNVSHVIAYVVIAILGTSFSTWLLSNEWFGIGKRHEWAVIGLRVIISLVMWLVIIGLMILIEKLWKKHKNKLENIKILKNEKEKVEVNKKYKIEHYDEIYKELQHCQRTLTNTSIYEGKLMMEINKLKEEIAKERIKYQNIIYSKGLETSKKQDTIESLKKKIKDLEYQVGRFEHYLKK